MKITLLFALLLMSIVLVFMGIRVLLVKGSKMSNHSVGGSKELRDQKVYCIKTQDKLERFHYKNKLKKEQDQAEEKDCEYDYDCDTCPCPKI